MKCTEIFDFFFLIKASDVRGLGFSEVWNPQRQDFYPNPAGIAVRVHQTS